MLEQQASGPSACNKIGQKHDSSLYMQKKHFFVIQSWPHMICYKQTEKQTNNVKPTSNFVMGSKVIPLHVIIMSQVSKSCMVVNYVDDVFGSCLKPSMYSRSAYKQKDLIFWKRDFRYKMNQELFYMNEATTIIQIKRKMLYPTNIHSPKIYNRPITKIIDHIIIIQLKYSTSIGSLSSKVWGQRNKKQTFFKSLELL